jgi:twitching motility two-component system response regulator PilH
MAKVLIVDDSPTVVTVFSKFLNDHGHECVTACDGDMGFNRAKEHKPDVILMDVVMGEHNGFQTCRRLKRDMRTRDIPVVIVSSKATEADEFWGRRMGAAEYLRKPVSPETLLATISRLT